MNEPARTWPRQPFVGIALAAICGIAIADWLPQAGLTTIALVGATVIVAAFVRRPAVTYLAIAAAFFLLHSERLAHSAGQRLAERLGNEVHAVIARGMVVSEPKITASGTATFVFAVESLDVDGTPEPFRVRMLTRWKHPVQFGDELALFGTAEAIPPPRNPGEFDMRSYLRRQDITRQLIVRYAENGTVVKHSLGNIVLRAAQRSREWLRATLTRGLDDSPDVQNLISGMALGLRHQTPEDIEEPFQQTGTLHLFAVAGLHVGIVAQLLWIVASVARVPRKTATVIIIFLLFFYAAVTGLHTSSVRAALMAAVLLGGFLVERKVYSLNSLAVAAFILLCWNTNELFSSGFQLSFAVVATILLVAQPAFRFLRKRLSFDPFLPRTLYTPMQRITDKVLWWIARGTSVSFAAWVGSLPLMLWYYNLVTTISVVSNLVVVPIAFFVLAGALISAIAAPFSTQLSLIFNNANWLLSRMIIGAVHLFAMLPAGHFYVEHPHLPTGAVLDITALDVGTGGAIHVRTARIDWLIDAGRKRDFDRTVRPYLRARGTNSLDALLLTHADAAHIGGAADAIAAFAPRTTIQTGARARSPTAHQLALLMQTRTERVMAAAPAEYSLSHSVTARVLYPPAGFEADSADDQAIVVQLLVDSQPRVLLMSDSGEATERVLLANGADLRADVIIKGQHRSGISGSPEFLDAVRPQAIIATSSDFPQNEQLKDDWIALLQQRGIRLFRQDQTGAVRLLMKRNGSLELLPYLSGVSFRTISR